MSMRSIDQGLKDRSVNMREKDGEFVRASGPWLTGEHPLRRELYGPKRTAITLAVNTMGDQTNIGPNGWKTA